MPVKPAPQMSRLWSAVRYHAEVYEKLGLPGWGLVCYLTDAELESLLPTQSPTNLNSAMSGIATNFIDTGLWESFEDAKSDPCTQLQDDT